MPLITVLPASVTLVPLYTPMRTDEEDVSIDRVFYGAINVYLEQKSALFRHTPWLVDRLLDGKGLLDWASRKGASTDARQLGDLTLSVLQGEDELVRDERRPGESRESPGDLGFSDPGGANHDDVVRQDLVPDRLRSLLAAPPDAIPSVLNPDVLGGA